VSVVDVTTGQTLWKVDAVNAHTAVDMSRVDYGQAPAESSTVKGHTRCRPKGQSSGSGSALARSQFHRPLTSNDQNLWMALGQVT